MGDEAEKRRITMALGKGRKVSLFIVLLLARYLLYNYAI